MATFEQMVDEVVANLAGYGMRQDNLTHLISPMTSTSTSTSTSISVASGDSLGKGIIEIEDELIWVDSYDSTTGIASIPPYGRGYLLTEVASHAAGTKVVISPTYNRAMIKKAINDTILAAYPTLFSVNSHTFSYTPARTTYSIPSEVEGVLSVTYETIGPSKRWAPVRGWALDTMADFESVGSTKSIDIQSSVQAGRKVKVTYTYEPDVLVNNGDDFSATTGLAESAKDVIVLGACYRMLSFIEPGRLSMNSVETDTQNATVPYGSGTNVTKYVYALYQQRLNEEAAKLMKRFPVRPHYSS